MDVIPFVKRITAYGHVLCYHTWYTLTVWYNTYKYTFPEIQGYNKSITQQNNGIIKQVRVVLRTYFILLGSICITHQTGEVVHVTIRFSVTCHAHFYIRTTTITEIVLT